MWMFLKFLLPWSAAKVFTALQSLCRSSSILWPPLEGSKGWIKISLLILISYWTVLATSEVIFWTHLITEGEVQLFVEIHIEANLVVQHMHCEIFKYFQTVGCADLCVSQSQFGISFASSAPSQCDSLHWVWFPGQRHHDCSSKWYGFLWQLMSLIDRHLPSVLAEAGFRGRPLWRKLSGETKWHKSLFLQMERDDIAS